MTKRSLECTNTEKGLLTAAIGLLIVAGGLYVYFVNQTVQNVVLRKSLEREIAVLSSEVSELEAEYINVKNTITLDYAQSMGYVESPKTLFVSRVTPTVSLTLGSPSAN